jgi:ATP-dependent Clp protease ATP-binding subunit ClpB
MHRSRGLLHDGMFTNKTSTLTANSACAQVAQLLAPEREKLLHLPDALHQRVVGQDQAVDAVADSIQRQGLHGAGSTWFFEHADHSAI